jgi:serine O-acetyltransferase
MKLSSTEQQWGIATLVSELQAVRLKSQQNQQRFDNPPKLPSTKILTHIVEQLAAVLFPNRLGMPDLHDEGVDYYVGHTLESVLRQLYRQIVLELQFKAESDASFDLVNTQAVELTRQFAEQLPDVRRMLETDIQAAYEGDPAAGSPDEVLVCYPGITAVIHHRLAHPLYKLGAPLLARIIAEIAHSATGIDIHPGAHIGESFFIDHGTGVVIGETAIIGNRVRIYQAVTLGAKRFAKDDNGVLVKGNLRHPIVEDDVVIYAGATILGRITIGKGSTIGGNVWLTSSVAPGSQISQAQSRRHDCFENGGGI